MVVLVVGILLAGLFYAFAFTPNVHRKSPRIRCVNNLKNVGMAFRIYAVDHDDKFPGELAVLRRGPEKITAIDLYRSLTNLPDPRHLVCPEDKAVRPAANMGQATAANLSYFASITARETEPQVFLAGDRHLVINGQPARGVVNLSTHAQLGWSQAMHQGEGNICMADGSVQLFPPARLQQGLLDQQITNTVVFP